MAQMTWRTSDELLERVRAQAAQHGHSLNEWVTRVLDAVTDPSSAGDEAQQVRERLARAGLLESTTAVRQRPGKGQLARARAAAGRGTSLAQLVADGRR
jgi:plasmid stability protein